MQWTRGRIAATVAVVAMAAMWGYVLYLAFGPGRQPPPDRLDDQTFSRGAEEVCAMALDDVAELPKAVQARSARERAAIVDQANTRFARMLDDLDLLVPSGEDGAIVSAWLTDWRTYLDDREAYARALRSDPDARLYVTAKERDQITEFIDAFAADNRMPACGTPIDV